MIKVDSIFYKLINNDEVWSLRLKLLSSDFESIKKFLEKYYGKDVADKFDISLPALFFTLHESLDNLKMMIENLENNNLQGFLLHLDSSYKSSKLVCEYLIRDFDISCSKIGGCDA